jgi:hypothetical protein
MSSYHHIVNKLLIYKDDQISSIASIVFFSFQALEFLFNNGKKRSYTSNKKREENTQTIKRLKSPYKLKESVSVVGPDGTQRNFF